MEKSFKFDFLDKVADSVTGFTGVIVARADYYKSDNRYQVQPVEGVDVGGSKIPDSMWIDEGRLIPS